MPEERVGGTGVLLGGSRCIDADIVVSRAVMRRRQHSVGGKGGGGAIAIAEEMNADARVAHNWDVPHHASSGVSYHCN